MSTGGVLARMIMSLALVFGIWNPTGYCYLNWVSSSGPLLAEKAAATFALLIPLLLFIRVAQSSLGRPGLAATVAVLITGAFSLSELGVIDIHLPRTRTYLFLVCSALVFTVGLVWSLFKERIIGQANYLNPPP